MNTYELAELTAVLARHGQAGQCSIRAGGPLRAPRIVILKNNALLATITDQSDGSCRAYNSAYHALANNTFYGYPGHSKAEALANLLDNIRQQEYRDRRPAPADTRTT